MPVSLPVRRRSRLARVLYAYAFLDEFVLLYPLYTLLFARTGLSAGQISSLFILWSFSALVLEVPAGALADAVSRRALLAVGPLLGALGFGLWVAVPSYPAFAAGFVLWGVKSALVSGALEALVYDELRHDGAAGDFAGLWGRAQGFGVVAVLAATVLASPVLARGGYAAVGAGSVLAGIAAGAVALAFPEHRRAGVAGVHGGEPGYLGTIRAGLHEVRDDRRVRRAVLLVPGVTAIAGALEEYTPLLAAAGGATETEVPWWQAVIWLGMTAGGLISGRATFLGSRGLAALVAAAGLLLVGGAATGTASGLVLVAVALGLMQVGGVLAQTRLQESVASENRATVTSLAALGEEVASIAVYACFGALAGVGGDGFAFAVLALPYLGVAAWVASDASGLRARRG